MIKEDGNFEWEQSQRGCVEDYYCYFDDEYGGWARVWEYTTEYPEPVTTWRWECFRYLSITNEVLYIERYRGFSSPEDAMTDFQAWSDAGAHADREHRCHYVVRDREEDDE